MLQQVTDSLEEDDEAELDTLVEDVSGVEQENRRDDIVMRLREEIGLQHPIVFENFDICQYYREGKLKCFNIPMLKEICDHFKINFKAHDKKATFLQKLSDLVRECDGTTS